MCWWRANKEKKKKEKEKKEREEEKKRREEKAIILWIFKCQLFQTDCMTDYNYDDEAR